MNEEKEEGQGREVVEHLPVLPLVSPAVAAQQWATYQELKRKLLTDEDFSNIKGKRHANKSAFRKLAVFFGLSDDILQQERVEREDDSFLWRIVVEARAPNGRTTVGVGICDSREREFAHVEHDVYATAHTRAKNRAFSDMFAGGIISAEELEAEVAPPPPAAPPVQKKKERPEAPAKEPVKEERGEKKVFGEWPDEGEKEFW